MTDLPMSLSSHAKLLDAGKGAQTKNIIGEDRDSIRRRGDNDGRFFHVLFVAFLTFAFT
jgi:hypothetical protein